MINGNTLNSQPLNIMNYIDVSYKGILLDLIVQDIDNADLLVYDSDYVDIVFVDIND